MPIAQASGVCVAACVRIGRGTTTRATRGEVAPIGFPIMANIASADIETVSCIRREGHRSVESEGDEAACARTFTEAGRNSREVASRTICVVVHHLGIFGSDDRECVGRKRTGDTDGVINARNQGKSAISHLPERYGRKFISKGVVPVLKVWPCAG